MPHRRFGVVLLVPEPWAREVDGLRRALGDGALGRIAPHVTLVPPVNVRDDRRAEVLEVLRAAAAPAPPMTLTLGPVATFWPENPVLYLAVGGDDVDVAALSALRDAAFDGPLHRTEAWPFVPHVTVASDAAPAQIEQATAALDAYRAEVVFTHVHLLEAQGGDGEPHRWVPVADVELGGTRVVGRGGLPVELTVSTQPDPDASVRATVAVTARREGAVVGSAEARIVGTDLVVDAVDVVPAARGQGVGRHLARALEGLARERGCGRLVATMARSSGAAGWFEGLGWAPDQASDLGIWVRRVDA